ncbi:hypothetical protein D3C80_1773880 [compost metagenome]
MPYAIACENVTGKKSKMLASSKTEILTKIERIIARKTVFPANAGIVLASSSSTESISIEKSFFRRANIDDLVLTLQGIRPRCLFEVNTMSKILVFPSINTTIQRILNNPGKIRPPRQKARLGLINKGNANQNA